MKRLRNLIPTFALATFLLSGAASAQCSRVIENGTVQNNKPVVWVAPCVIGQAGPSSGSGGVGALPMFNDLGVQGPLGVLDGPITGPYHQGLFNWSSTTSGEFDLNLGSFGGASTPTMAVIVNGTKYPFPGAGSGNVIVSTSPSTPVAGNLTLWNGGTTVKDSGVALSSLVNFPSVANIAALKAYPLSGLSANFIIGVASYSTPGDMPSDSYYLSIVSCSLNSGTGDGFSQIPSNTAGNCWLIMPQSVYDARQAGVVVGGTDPNANNATQLTAALTYAGSLSGNAGTIDLGGQTVGFNGHVEISSGRPTLQNGTLLCISSCGSAGQGTAVSTTFWNNTGPQTNSVWTPAYPWSGAVPVGMIDIAVTAQVGLTKDGPTVQNVTVNCNYVASCAAITNYASNARFYNNRLFSWTTMGFFNTTTVDFQGNHIWEGNATQWQGTGIYIDTGAKQPGATFADSIYSHNVIWGVAQGAFVNQNDFKFTSNHIFPDPVGPSSWKGIVFAPTALNGTVNNNTFDNAEVVQQRTAGVAALAQISFKGNIFENGLGAAVDGQFVLQCLGTPACGSNITNQANILFPDPIPNDDNGNFLQVYDPVVLEDASGNFNPDAFSTKVQQQWGTGSNCTYACNNGPSVNTTPQGAQFTFTGNVAIGAFQITGATILPAQGTGISDSMACIPVGAKLTDLSYRANKIWYSASSAPGSACAGDTITVGSLTLSGTVNAATSGQPFTISVTNLSPFALYEHITDSAGCVNHWVSGYNDHTGVVLINNDPNTGATCSASSDTFTVTPYQYYLSPRDSGSLMLSNTTNATTFFLRNDNPLAWFADISPRGGCSNPVALSPLGSSQINSQAAALTILDCNTVRRLNLVSVSNDMYEFNNEVIGVPSGLGTGWGSSPQIVPGTAQGLSFEIDVGGGGTANFGVINLPPLPSTITAGWHCSGSDITTPTAGTLQQSATGASSATVANYKANALSAWNAGDILVVSCRAF